MAKTTKTTAKPEVQDEESYRLLELRTEGFKKVNIVSIKPPGGVGAFTLSGRNEQGKSSVLDSFVAAVSGKTAMPPKPVREGHKEAVIHLDFGGLKLTRRIWTKREGGTAHDVVVQYADGSKPKYPQNVLDELRGSPIADDPLAFSRMKPKDQFELLKTLVPDFDFAAQEQTRKALFEERTQVGRDRDRAKGALDSMAMPETSQTQLVDVTALAADLRAVSDHNAQIDRRQAGRDALRDDIEVKRDAIDRMHASIKSMEAEIAAAEKKLEEAEALPEKMDAAKIEAQIADAESTNGRIRAAESYRKAEAEVAAFSDLYDELTQQIEGIDDKKTAAIAKAKLPVKGLTLGDEEVLVDGLPFEQASTARRIQIATALLMAMKPKLRVLLIREGSLLDDDAMAALDASAREHGFLVLVERVGAGDEYGVVIEDGEVAS